MDNAYALSIFCYTEIRIIVDIIIKTAEAEKGGGNIYGINVYWG